jgi:hypothetical protein
VTKNQSAVAVEATVARAVWRDSFGAFMGLVADCFPRRESRQALRETVEAVRTCVASRFVRTSRARTAANALLDSF